MPKFSSEDEVVQEKDEKKEKAIVPPIQISEKYYKTILPFEPSKARGMVVNNLNSRYDIKEFETGLMRIAQKEFSPDKYLFQEGQHLDKKTVKAWLKRKYTKGQMKKHKLDDSKNLGLNPPIAGDGYSEEQNEKNPIYLAHILEHNYLVKDKDEEVKLGGVVIGLAMNSVHYYQKEEYGATHEAKIPPKEMEEKGREIAQEVLERLRKKDELKNVPIMFGIFEQATRDSVVPGNFIAYTSVGSRGNKITDWKTVKEKYYLFPSSEAEEDHRDHVTAFLNFKHDVEDYFPNFSGVIGRAFYQEDQLVELNIDIPIQFYGTGEVVGFTQYVTGLILRHFADHINIRVNVTSFNEPSAVIVKNPSDKEPFVHIYD